MGLGSKKRLLGCSARRRWSVAQHRPWRRRQLRPQRRERWPLPPRAWAEPLATCPRTHGGRGCWSDGCHGGSWRGGWLWDCLRPGPRHGLGAGEHAFPASAGQRGRGRAGRPVRQQHERRHAAPALHAALQQQHFRQPRKQPPRSLASKSRRRPITRRAPSPGA